MKRIILLRNYIDNICGYHNTTVFVNIYVMFMTGLQKEFKIREIGAEPRPGIAVANNNNEVLQMKKIKRRKVDPLGRVILPAEFRTRLGIEKDSEIEIVCEKDRMIIRKIPPTGVIIPLSREQ